jgi:hypothetical protein
MTKKKTTEQFIFEATEIHGYKYDYSLVEYINVKSKVKILCKIHGVFEQTPDMHLSKRGCWYCGGSKKLTNNEFIQRSEKIHDKIYDYSKVKYINKETHVIIICNIHGEFSQLPHNHVRGQQGCPKCVGKNKTNKEFIEECIKNIIINMIIV